MPRSARAGASSRRATRFNAPRGSPAASARAAWPARKWVRWALAGFGALLVVALLAATWLVTTEAGLRRAVTLVESVAEHVAAIVRDEFGAPWVKVSVTKFAIIPGIKGLGITIERGARL